VVGRVRVVDLDRNLIATNLAQRAGVHMQIEPIPEQS
jgi:hypothetical protein